MPCDESPVYMGSSEPADSPRITGGSRRSGNKTISSNSSSSSSRSGNQPLVSQALSVGLPRNDYGTVVVAARPLHSATAFSTSCSSSSSSSSSGSSTASSSCSPSSFDRAPRNESSNSSSSLILILERATDVEAGKSEDSLADNQRTATAVADNQFQEEAPSFSGLAGRGVTSSLETLAKRKAARCRRRRSTTSPRNNNNNNNNVVRRQRSSSRETLEERLRVDGSRSVESSALPMDDDEDGFVATSTLTKNRDTSNSGDGSGVLSVLLTNSSRSAGKVKLHSSASSDALARNLRPGQDTGLRTNLDIGVASYPPTPVKLQQSTISVASIRGTNITCVDSSTSNNNSNNNNNNNNNGNNNYLRIGGSPPGAAVRSDNITAGHFAVRVRCNVPSASAPALHRYHHQQQQQHNQQQKHQQQQMANLTRAFSTHSASPHSSVPLGSVTPVAFPGSSSSQPAKQNDRTSATPSAITTTTSTTTGTTCSSTRVSPVKPPPSYLTPGLFLAPGKSGDAAASFARVDSSSSLKSSSFSTGKMMMKVARPRTSLHASLGQLPINASCSNPIVVGLQPASLENLDNGFFESNVDPTASVPITTHSSGSPVDATSTFSPYATTRTSLERVCYSTGASTMSSASSKTPLALPSTTNTVNVAGAFKNSIVTNCNNNNNNNGRCNHPSGTCNGTCNATTTTSQTSSTLTRTPNLANGQLASTSSSWTNNSAEQETDYVVDPVQGNAYHKGQFLGKGGFARVYLMTDVANGNQYACKIIPKNRMQKIHIQKIAREIMIHKELNHVNVVQMHHYFEDNINVYMLLEPCPRKSLMHVLKYRGKVTEPEARYYMKQMVTGVAYIHSQKVVHRDLKPGNMFLSDGMIVKIGDFGLATRPDGQRRRVTICGTPNYIAPEVLYKQAYSYEADVWALGCILYALLAGQPPFDTATLKETYARICNNRYKKLDDSVVSRSGQDLIRWLLQPIPELRPSLERVKEHAYLTMEYVPTKLAHTCCYRMPAPQAIAPEQSQSGVSQQLGLSTTSVISRALVSTENIERNKRDNLAVGAIMQKSLHHMTSGTVSQAQLEALKIAGQKKPKVGNWLFRKLPKLPRFRQRLSRLLCPEHKKPDSLMMHRALAACLAEIRCTRAQENPMLVDRIAPLFVTKWIDYSNKYGLGFQLSDRSVGVLFNDSTKMSYTHDRRRVEYATTDDEVTRYRRELDVPSSMEEKLELLRHFTHYMDNFLTNGGEVKEQRQSTKQSRANSSSVPRMRRWLRTDKAIVMELTVPLLQVNFFVDHSKIVVSEGIRGRGYLVTYIDASRQASSYWLNDLRDVGCTAELYERLHYVCKVIAELENEAIFDPPSTVTHQQHRKPFRT